MSHPYSRRLLKEYKALSINALPGIHMLPQSDVSHFEFEMKIENPHYANQTHLLVVDIVPDYPVDSPLVKFLHQGKYVVPLHPHIYSNGHICLNLLGKDWTPACGIETILLSIQSVLNHNEVLERPPDNESYVIGAPKDPKKTSFVYHDDNV